MPASRQDKTTPSSSRRTVKHVQPLQKGLACLTCSARRVRCSGERPACAACVRHARWSGRDTTNDHGCRYRESSVTTEEEQPVEEQPEPAVELTEEQKELSAAKARIRELEQQVAALSAHQSLNVALATAFAPPTFSASLPATPQIHFPTSTMSSFPTPSSAPNSPSLDYFSFIPTDPVLPSFTAPPPPPSSLAHTFDFSLPQTRSPFPDPSSISNTNYTPPPTCTPSPVPSQLTYYDPTPLNELLSMPIKRESTFEETLLFGGRASETRSRPEGERLLVDGWEVEGWKRLGK